MCHIEGTLTSMPSINGEEENLQNRIRSIDFQHQNNSVNPDGELNAETVHFLCLLFALCHSMFVYHVFLLNINLRIFKHIVIVCVGSLQ